MKRLGIIVALLAVIVGAGLFLLNRRSDCAPGEAQGGGEGQTEPSGGGATVRPGEGNPNEASEGGAEEGLDDSREEERRILLKGISGYLGGDSDGLYTDEDGKAYPEADQKLLRMATQVVEKDDVKAARELAKKAVKSSNRVVRKAAVDALAWFGSSGMAEMTAFLSDVDDEIASAARDNWEEALQDIENDSMKADIIKAALMGLEDTEMIQDIANELVGIDELAALQVITELLESGRDKVADALKEAYQDITGGDEWAGRAGAEAWLKENYEPPESE